MGRLDGVPDVLRRRLEQALEEEPGDDHDAAEGLRRLAGVLLRGARGEGAHDEALTLLAADAMITYACEALAAQDPHRLASVQP